MTSAASARADAPRILLIDYAYQNINRTVMLWPLAWRHAGAVTAFGPGHVSGETWRAGLRAFLSRHGPFDVVVAAEMLAANTLPEYSVDHLLEAIDRIYDCPFDIRTAIESNRRVFDEFASLESIKIISMLEYDTYNMYDSYKSLLEATDTYIVGWGEDFVRPRAQLDHLAQESFGHRVQDNWWTFVTENRHRVITSGAMIAESEFHWAKLDHRSPQWAVQGARYAARRKARKALSDARIAWTGRALVDAISLINRIDARMLRRPLVRTLMNHRWEEGFRRSRYAFTCGSALRFPIRKYFEIPASGAVLAAQPCNGFEALGFRDRETAVVTEPETIVEVHRWLEANPVDAQRIASAGRELVWRRHSVQARGRQYAEAIEAIFARRFGGSRWVDGDFRVIEPHGAPSAQAPI